MSGSGIIEKTTEDRWKRIKEKGEPARKERLSTHARTPSMEATPTIV